MTLGVSNQAIGEKMTLRVSNQAIGDQDPSATRTNEVQHPTLCTGSTSMAEAPAI